MMPGMCRKFELLNSIGKGIYNKMKLRTGKFFGAVLLFLLLYAGAGSETLLAQKPIYQAAKTNSRYAHAIHKSRELINSLIDVQHIPGLEVAVSVNGQKVWAQGFGYADLENKVPVWPNTKMRIGSVSKLLTSAALGKLMEAGKIDIDAPVRNYIPYFPKKKYIITTHELAGHLAGIRHYRGDEFLNSKHYNSVKAGLKIFMDDSLLFKPGTDYHYSSYGWNLISAAIEGASGVPFLTFMQQKVIDPLNMNQTVPGYNKKIIYHRTQFYALNDQGQIVNAPYVDNSYKWASGGFLSTVNDLLKFGNAMLGNQYLSRKTIELLWKPQHTTSGENTHHGMDWASGKDSKGYYWVGHSGGSVGGTTQFVIYPKQKVIVAVICNLGDVSYHDIQLKIADKFIAVDSI